MIEKPIAISAIRRRLQRLSYLKLVAFSASSCEYLLPHYSAFVHRFNCGDVEPLRIALDRVWGKLGGSRISRLEYEALSKRCAEVAPDPGGFAESEKIIAERAWRAAEAIRETFGGCAQRSREQISRAARLVLDTVVLRIYSPESDDRRSSREMLDGREAVRDLRNQLDVIAVLEMLEVLTPSFLAALRGSVRVEEGRDTGS